MAHNITVPDIGDFDSVEIIEILVKVGDQINKDDPIVTLESDKSSVEVPSTVAGKITKLNIEIGDKVSKGSLLATLDDGGLDTNNNKEINNSPSATEEKIVKKIDLKNVNTKENKIKNLIQPYSKDDLDPIETSE